MRPSRREAMTYSLLQTRARSWMEMSCRERWGRSLCPILVMGAGPAPARQAQATHGPCPCPEQCRTRTHLARTELGAQPTLARGRGAVRPTHTTRARQPRHTRLGCARAYRARSSARTTCSRAARQDPAPRHLVQTCEQHASGFPSSEVSSTRSNDEVWQPDLASSPRFGQGGFDFFFTSPSQSHVRTCDT